MSTPAGDGEDRMFRILLVDDDNEVLNSLYMTIKRSKLFKARISIAGNGHEGLEALEDKVFDLVISDYKMPKMDGLEFLRTVKDRYPDTMRIMLTGYSDMDVIKDAINTAHVHNYIEKPWENEELNKVVLEALQLKISQEAERRRVAAQQAPTETSTPPPSEGPTPKDKEENPSMVELLLNYDP